MQSFRNVPCRICLHLLVNTKNACDTYLLDFLLQLRSIIDDTKMKIDELFQSSIFSDSHTINQISCNGLTLMHVNILGGRTTTLNDNGEEEDNQNFLPVYDEFDAIQICRILLERGASPHGNIIYEMRPLHIAIRRDWLNLTELLLQAGANPNLPERDIYASRPMDIAVLNDDPELVKLLHRYGGFLHGFKTMFHAVPLAEAFVRGYFDVFKTLLELGARPTLDLDRNTFRSFGSQLFLTGEKGRQSFIQLLYEHGGNIETELKLHTIRIEPDGISRHKPEFQFTCDPICIIDVDSSILIKWMCRTRSLKEWCRLAFRRYCFFYFDDGYRRLCSFEEKCSVNRQLYNYLMFKN